MNLARTRRSQKRQPTRARLLALCLLFNSTLAKRLFDGFRKSEMRFVNCRADATSDDEAPPPVPSRVCRPQSNFLNVTKKQG